MRSLSDNIGKYLQNLNKSFNKIKPEIWLIFIIIFALIIRLHFFVGMNLNDDLCYLNSAYDITQGEFTLNEWIFSPRIMMHYPIAFFYAIFGISDFSGALYILLCSLGNVAVAYFIGKTLFNSKVGLMSAFLMSFFPIEVLFGTTIVPDPPVAFFMGLSVCLFLMGEKKNKIFFYILAGLAIGLAWLVKSLAILIILFYLSYFLFDKIFGFKYLISGIKQEKYTSRIRNIFSIRKGFILTALGFLLVLFLEGMLYFITNNNFFLRFKIETSHYTSSLMGCNFNLDFYPRMLFAQTSSYFDYFGVFFVIFGACVFLLILFEKNKKYIILVIWALSILLWMQYGTMNPFEYVPMHRLYRFLTVITIPISVTIGYFIVGSKVNKKKILNIGNVIIISALIITSFSSISMGHFYMDQSMIDFREIADFLKDHPSKDIYVDEDTRGKLDFLLSYKRTENLRLLNQVKNSSDIKDAFVIVNSSRGFVEDDWLRSQLPDFIYNPPENWEIAKIVTSAYIGFYRFYDPVIYYVPP